LQEFDPVGLPFNQPPLDDGCRSISLPTCICDTRW